MLQQQQQQQQQQEQEQEQQQQQQEQQQQQQQQQQQRHEHLVERRCVNYMSGISSINTTLFWYLATDIIFWSAH